MNLKISLQVCALTMLCATGLTLTALQTGCAATPTKQSTGELVDDTTITTKIKAAFIKDDTVKAGDVSVETFKGVVQLSGFVDTAEQKQRAGEIAREIPGVHEVENKITVK